jgi:hypothetical protein
MDDDRVADYALGEFRRLAAGVAEPNALASGLSPGRPPGMRTVAVIAKDFADVQIAARLYAQHPHWPL